MIELFLIILWCIAFIITAVPPIGRFVYFHVLSRFDGLKTLLDDKLFR
jgi:hypothetical protein